MAQKDLHPHPAVTREATYGALATVYDRLMAHVPYDEWYRYITEIIRTRLHTLQPRILEMGAGTATLGRRLTQAGFSWIGSDLSAAMCRQSTTKGVPCVCADARRLPLRTRFDLALFLYDAINYLTRPTEWEALFRQVFEVLEPGGLFLFDITTESNSRERFSDYVDFEDLGDSFYTRHSYYDIGQKLQFNDFTIFTRVSEQPPLYHKDREVHCQKIFSPAEVRAMVPGNLFSLIGIWDGFSFKPPQARSERIHFLVQRASA